MIQRYKHMMTRKLTLPVCTSEDSENSRSKNRSFGTKAWCPIVSLFMLEYHLSSQCQWLWIFMKSQDSLGQQPMSVPSWLSIVVWLQAYCMSATFLCLGCIGCSTDLSLCPLSTYKQSRGIILSNAINDWHPTNFQWHFPGYTEERRGIQVRKEKKLTLNPRTQWLGK